MHVPMAEATSPAWPSSRVFIDGMSIVLFSSDLVEAQYLPRRVEIEKKNENSSPLTSPCAPHSLCPNARTTRTLLFNSRPSYFDDKSKDGMHLFKSVQESILCGFAHWAFEWVYIYIYIYIYIHITT